MRHFAATVIFAGSFVLATDVAFAQSYIEQTNAGNRSNEVYVPQLSGNGGVYVPQMSSGNGSVLVPQVPLRARVVPPRPKIKRKKRATVKVAQRRKLGVIGRAVKQSPFPTVGVGSSAILATKGVVSLPTVGKGAVLFQ